MRDIVETVISGIMQKERMQQNQQVAAGRPSLPRLPLHSVGHQVPVNDSKPKDPALWKASVQFEAIFMQQMMSEMRSTVTKSDFMPHGFAEDVHASMMDEAIAQAATKHNSIGIANAVYRQLESASHPQAIGQVADKLKMSSDLTLEVTGHAD